MSKFIILFEDNTGKHREVVNSINTIKAIEKWEKRFGKSKELPHVSNCFKVNRDIFTLRVYYKVNGEDQIFHTETRLKDKESISDYEIEGLIGNNKFDKRDYELIGYETINKRDEILSIYF